MSPIAAPSSDSNAYVRRMMRCLLRPLAATALSPNTITWMRIVAGLAACAACCIGEPIWDRTAAVLWVASALLDRGDGEFARLTRRCSEDGRLLDYRGDVAINALIFLAMGVRLRDAGWGAWPLLIGAVAMAVVASASILAERLELRIGAKTVPSRYGFDSDDILFVLAPILWLGGSLSLLLGAALGGTVVALYIWHRLLRLSPPSPAQASAGGDLPPLSRAQLMP
jgi:phosphatidylglycerophosphate synthase